MCVPKWTPFDDMADVYDRCLGPLLFAPFAEDLARRLSARGMRSLLEVAAGTGILTRVLAARLDSRTAIVATDIDRRMVTFALRKGGPATWRQADAADLPFAQAAFDAVVCQFGVMFFPSKINAFREIRRVLRPSGCFLLNVWDRIETNELTEIAAGALDPMFGPGRSHFLRGPVHRYCDAETIRSDLKTVGFADPHIEMVPLRSRAASARDIAFGVCHGSPLRAELAQLGPQASAAAMRRVESAIIKRFGEGAIETALQALVVVAHAEA